MAGARHLHGAATSSTAALRRNMPGDIHAAARSGDIAALNLAIAQKQNLNAQDSLKRTPLQLAAWSGQTEAVKLLLSAGANVGLGATDGVTGGCPRRSAS